jgi:hypothetical protein
VLDLVGESHRAPIPVRRRRQNSGEARPDPTADWLRNCDEQRSIRIDRDQLQRVQPDGEGALADCLEQQLSDLLPGRTTFRPRRPELGAHRGEVDRDQSTAIATALGEVGLLDDDLVGAGPLWGVGGVGSGVLGFWGSLPARALGGGVFGGVSGGVSGESVRPAAPFPRESPSPTGRF